MKTLKALAFIFMMGSAFIASAQSAKEKALEQAKKAMKLEEDGDIPGAIKLLEESQKLEPSNTTYTYELAYAYYIQKDYKKAQKYLEDIIDSKSATDRFYQLLGNSYDMEGKPDKAIEIYSDGVKKFPNSGKLYNELGIMQIQKKEYNKALVYHEKGIKMDPEYSSNYYWATKIFCASEEEVWGMIYGEIFINLERDSKRTAEISKLLYDTYKSEIQYSSDTSMAVSFSKGVMMVSDPKKMKLPFGVGVYEPTIMLSMLSTRHITINSLDTIRSNFVETYYKMKHNKDYPNVLFEYQKKLQEAGHLAAYNHWLLMKGDETGFATWVAGNKDKWTSFVKWFPENGLKLDDNHKFFRSQYD